MAKTNLDYVSLLSKDSVVADGNITVPSHLKISGIVKMNIESGGKVVITETGMVEGFIRAADVQVHGKVEGDIIAADGLTIHPSGSVNGRVAAQKLRVEEGATCNFVMAIGKEAMDRRKANIDKKSPEESSRKEPAAASKGDKNISSEVRAENSASKKAAGESELAQASRKNGQDKEKTSAKMPVDKGSAATKIDKIDEPLPKDKEWVDRFW